MSNDKFDKAPPGTALFASPQPPAQVPGGLIAVPREFVEEYIALLEGAEFKAVHSLVRIKAAAALLTGALAAPSISEEEPPECQCGGPDAPVNHNDFGSRFCPGPGKCKDQGCPAHYAEDDQ